MFDPYKVLGLPNDADDETIRRRYLELVKQFPPGQDAKRFQEIRQAYDQLRDLETRLRQRLFHLGDPEPFEKLIEELTCQKSRRRVSLKTLISLIQKPT